jgi:hypothetical protein
MVTVDIATRLCRPGKSLYRTELDAVAQTATGLMTKPVVGHDDIPFGSRNLP